MSDKSCTTCVHCCTTSSRCGAYDGLHITVARDLTGLCGPQASNHRARGRYWRGPSAAQVQSRAAPRHGNKRAHDYPHSFGNTSPYRYAPTITARGLLHATGVVAFASGGAYACIRLAVALFGV